MQDQVDKLPGSKALASFCEKDDSAKEFTKDLRSILEVTAATGRYWHDWAQLRVLLCFRLTQVLQEFHKLQYPEDAALVIGPPPPENEPFPDMKERLVQILDSFSDGAPFTSQRLCEVLLCPKDTYNNLDKLALALEKLLLVQSTYPPCTDPYPLQPLPGAVPSEWPGEGQKTAKLGSDTVNGVQDSIESFKEMPAIDEEMVDVERVLDAQVPVDMVANSSSDMLHEPSGDEIPQAPGTSSEMLHDSTGVDLPQVPGTNSEMLHDSCGAETNQGPSTTSEMLLETTGTDTVQATATNADMLHDFTDAGRPRVPGTNFEMLQDSPIVELPQTVSTNSEMQHDSTSLELSNAAGSSTEMLHDSTVVELPPASEPVASNTEMLHDAPVVDLPSAPEESIDSIDLKLPRLEESASNQIDSSGVRSPQASQASVDMKQSCPEESVNSHVPNSEDRSEDDRVVLTNSSWRNTLHRLSSFILERD